MDDAMAPHPAVQQHESAVDGMPTGFGDKALRALLVAVAEGRRSVAEAVAALRILPFENLDFARIDHHRQLRQGFPEVIFCQGKTCGQVAEISAALAARSPRVLGTRASPEQFAAARARVPGLQYEALARALWVDREPERPRKAGVVLVAAGTADLPAAEEAALTLDLMGHRPARLNDVGVAGVQRVLSQMPLLARAHVVIVVAGMEGALASVIGGLVACPVVAVPTSVGYGASFQGLAALLAMLNSCAPGVGVMNIDNGFGAAHLAARINDLACAVDPGDHHDGRGGNT